MKSKAAAIAAMVIATALSGAADSAIVSITTGVAVRGDRASNLLANGSFEQSASGDPGPATAVYWSGVNGQHTESTLQAQVYTIPPSVFQLAIGANDSVFLTTASVNSVFSANSQRHFVEFSADATSETIVFTNFGHSTSGGAIPTAAELVRDDVILNRVSGPATVALVAIGMLGLFSRRGGTAAAQGASTARRRHKARNGWICSACAASALVVTGAAAMPIVLPGGPLYFQFRTAEQYSPGNDINNSANPAGVGTKPEGNWGIVQIMTISTGTLVPPTGFDIAGPGATVFSDGQNNGQQILGMFYAVLNNPGVSPSTSTGGVLDLYFWDKSSQLISAPLDPQDLGKRGKGGSQSGNSAASAPSQYQDFTCLPNTLGCTFLARFDFTPGADVRTGFNTNTIFTAANSTVSETYMAVDTATPGFWSDTLDSDFFTFDPIKQPCGPAVACKRANDARLDAPFILAPDWDIVGSDIVGLAKEGSLRVFSTPEPATLVLLFMGLAAAGAMQARRRAAPGVNGAWRAFAQRVVARACLGPRGAAPMRPAPAWPPALCAAACRWRPSGSRP